jgi:isoamylase
MRAGAPAPLGASSDGAGVNVAVFSAHATRIELCLFDAAGGAEIARHDLPARTDEVFHGHLPGTGPGMVYGLRAHGPWAPDAGHRFNPAKLLLDPYGQGLVGELAWNPALHGHVRDAAIEDDRIRDERDSAPFMPKSVLPASLPPGRAVPRPQVPWGRTLVLEAHAKGLTRLHPAIPEALRGRAPALGHAALIAHLKAQGVTAIELLPVQAIAPDRFQAERGLPNYWGYSTLSYFAPHPGYLDASGPAGLRDAIRRLHDAGIEVILDVVLNHTAEGDMRGTTLCWRGLDQASYYRLGPDGRMADMTGCGNTLNLAHPRVLQMALDSLRHWATAFEVDGFRFDLASALAREADGAFDAGAGFLDALLQDPLLSRLKLIAEPWDLGPGGYRLGGFPPGMAEWNDRFRDTARRFWRGDGGQRGELAARLAGSADLFDHRGRRPHASVNFITAHDGFTLADLVSYADRHNEANGEDNRDGHSDNASANWGAEGPTGDAAIRATRGAVARALLATLMTAQGTPMLTAGDEFGRTQQGNNNAYCQDNALSWVDWSLAATPDGAAMLRFAGRLAAIRAAHPSLRQDGFLHGDAEPLPGLPDIAWFGADGATVAPDAWEDPEARVLALRRLVCEAGTVDATLVLMNAGEEGCEVRLPAPALPWRRLLCTADPDAPEAACDATVTLPPRTLVILAAAVPAA